MAFDYSSIDGALTPEQALQALAGGEGDTSAELENGGAPDASTETGTETANDDSDKAGKPNEADTSGKEAGEPAAAQAEDPATAVVLARDGKHTIPYETLVKHREAEQHWKAQAEAAQQQLAGLQAQAQARADAGQAPTKADNLAAAASAAIDAGADANLFGDFSEEALKAGLLKLNEEMRDELRAELKDEMRKELAPLLQQKASTDAQSHYDAIYGKHPDADSIAQSSEFAAWVNGQPSAVRNAYWGLFDPKTGGTAAEIVEVFDAFKGASTPKPTTTAAADTKAAASAAVAGAKATPPASLSAIPGGHASGAAALDRTADMTGPEMYAATADMSPAQIEAWLNRSV